MSATVNPFDLAKHMEWADGVVWASVLESDAARMDSRLQRLLFHIHLVQRAFLHLWRGEDPHFPDPAEFPDAMSLARWARDGHEQIRAFLTSASPEVLARQVVVPWAVQIEHIRGRPATPATLAHTAIQLALHSAHHRGQVNVRLREVGATPPLIDFIAWVWWDQPSAEWPASIGSELAT